MWEESKPMVSDDDSGVFNEILSPLIEYG